MDDETQENNRGGKRSTQQRRRVEPQPPDQLDETQANSPATNTRGMPAVTPPPIQRHSPTQQHQPLPPPPSQQVRQAPPRTLPPRKQGKARNRRDSGLYLPLWSIVLMIVVVLGLVAGVILIFLNLGGRLAPEREPVLIIDTAVPTQRPNSFPISPATPTIPPEIDPNQLDVIPTAPPIILAGPTLFIPTLSPTPRPVEIGATVIVSDVGDQELNVRDQASVTDSVVIFRVPEGTRMLIVDGPRQGDGLTWWQVQDSRDPTRIGWAASNYLIPEP